MPGLYDIIRYKDMKKLYLVDVSFIITDIRNNTAYITPIKVETYEVFGKKYLVSEINILDVVKDSRWSWRNSTKAERVLYAK